MALFAANSVAIVIISGVILGFFKAFFSFLTQFSLGFHLNC